MQNWTQQVKDNFGGAANDYEAAADVQAIAAQNLTEMMPDDAKDILEVGCGTGLFTQYLVKRYPEARLTITDISPQMIKAAQRKIDHADIEWRVMDGEQSDIENRQYDVIVANMVFQWFVDREAALSKLEKLLKPGGVILYTQPGVKSFVEWRAMLGSLDLMDGLLEFKNPPNMIKQEFYEIEYGSALNFLKYMKEIGAHKSRPDYHGIGVALRMACRLYDREYNGRLRWHIVYGQHKAG